MNQISLAQANLSADLWSDHRFTSIDFTQCRTSGIESISASQAKSLRYSWLAELQQANVPIIGLESQSGQQVFLTEAIVSDLNGHSLQAISQVVALVQSCRVHCIEHVFFSKQPFSQSLSERVAINQSRVCTDLADQLTSSLLDNLDATKSWLEIADMRLSTEDFSIKLAELVRAQGLFKVQDYYFPTTMLQAEFVFKLAEKLNIEDRDLPDEFLQPTIVGLDKIRPGIDALYLLSKHTVPNIVAFVTLFTLQKAFPLYAALIAAMAGITVKAIPFARLFDHIEFKVENYAADNPEQLIEKSTFKSLLIGLLVASNRNRLLSQLSSDVALITDEQGSQNQYASFVSVAEPRLSLIQYSLEKAGFQNIGDK